MAPSFISLLLITSFVLFSAATCSSMAMAARPLNTTRSDLFERLKLGEAEGSKGCWDSLFRLQSCTGEVILFFMNGETYLGPSCCDAISFVEKHCWPSMLGSLGFTSEEGDILRGYCDASDQSSNPGSAGGGAAAAAPPPPPLTTDDDSHA